MSRTCIGSWHIRPTPSECEGKPGLTKTWAGPMSTEIYGRGLSDLCNKTKDNLMRLSLHMQKTDPCIEYGIKHWHPSSRPSSAKSEQLKISECGEKIEVLFSDNKVIDSLNTKALEERDMYIDPPVKNTFCYLCSTLEEHERHMLQHKPKKKYTGRPRISYIAPKPKQKRKEEDEEDVLVKERLYKVEIFTSDVPNAGTTAKVYIAIKGSAEYLPRTQLKKNRGCAQLCFMRASKEVFHVKGPFLGHLQILTIEHDGMERNQAWHLEKVHVTDVKVMKTWLFTCENLLSVYEKPLYSNKVDLQAEELQHPLTDYSIEIHTGKAKMAGTDSNIYITLYGQFGKSKKIMLKDSSSNQRLFERKSVDHFQIRMNGVGELKKIRIEHDGKGFASGWFLEKIIVTDSKRPRQNYYFMYGGWIAKDEGDGRLWREITAKKHLPKELKTGTETKYAIIVKTGDVRYAGTDANVFIKMVGENGITKQLPLDNPKNNFERNMTDNFEVHAINVGPLKNIIVGHDNANPGAGWFLEKVTVRRYIPKDEAVQHLKKMKKRLKKERQKKGKRKEDRSDKSETDSDSDEGRSGRWKGKSKRWKDSEKDDKEKETKLKKKMKNLFSVSSSSESESSSDEEGKSRDVRKRPASATRRPGSALSSRRGGKSRWHNESDESDVESDMRQFGRRRPQSAGRQSVSSSVRSRYSERNEYESDRYSLERKRDKYARDRRSSSASEEQSKQSYLQNRRVSTSASSLRKQQKQRSTDKDKDDEEEEEINDCDQIELKLPLFEECLFMCNRWLATDEDDGLCIRELKVTEKRVFYKDN